MEMVFFSDTIVPEHLDKRDSAGTVIERIKRRVFLLYVCVYVFCTYMCACDRLLE